MLCVRLQCLDFAQRSPQSSPFVKVKHIPLVPHSSFQMLLDQILTEVVVDCCRFTNASQLHVFQFSGWVAERLTPTTAATSGMQLSAVVGGQVDTS